MLTRSVSTPAFGEADLSNCEREPIHLAGSIQPHGALLLLREPDLTVVQASANAAAFLGLERLPAGQALRDLPGDVHKQVTPHLGDDLRELPRGIRCHVGEPPRLFDALMHRPKDGGLILELEPAGPPADLSGPLQKGLQAIITAASLRHLAEETARLFKTVTGYDRVMVYRFDDQGHGEVFTEEREPHLEPYLGNRYPASDIPIIARRLYERNRVRLLVDVEFAPVPLIPELSPLSDAPLDMSLCILRSSSPIHIQYLKNMGVRATLVVSLMVGGRLWGLVACHHYVPRAIHFELRGVCELFAEAVATRIAALESFAQAQSEIAVRRLEERMIRAISHEGDWRAALFDGSNALLDPVAATGAALLFDGEIRTVGEVPATLALREIGNWLDTMPRGLFATASIANDAPQFELLTPVASGLLATPISTAPGEYLIWLRPERVRTVTWGGNPFKPSRDADPKNLSPRRSFAQWNQVVEGTADAWTDADLSAARLIAETVSDVIIQFRSVRLLLAEDQITRFRRQVEHSDQPVLVANTDGHILKLNDAFATYLPTGQDLPRHIDDLLGVFLAPEQLRRHLDDMRAKCRPWRGEVGLIKPDGSVTPMLVRADPVFAPVNRTLGFVLLLTDLTERKAAEAARRSFQQGVIEQRPSMSGLLDTKTDLQFRNLLSTVVENAQMAALEIADRSDPVQMPQMLEALRASVTRTAEVLRYLLWHATRRTRPGARQGSPVSGPNGK